MELTNLISSTSFLVTLFLASCNSDINETGKKENVLLLDVSPPTCVLEGHPAGLSNIVYLLLTHTTRTFVVKNFLRKFVIS